MPTPDDDHAVPTTVAYRRSLRASRTRRATAALRRRRLFRGRGAILLATGLMVVGSAGAVAQEKSSSSKSRTVQAHSSATIKAAQQKLGVTADGVTGPQTRRAVKSFQRRNGLSVDGVIGPQTLKALGVTATSGASAPAGAGEAGGQLQKIAKCESAGDPTAVSASGQYRGKYQFDQPTWESVGGSGDPAAAPEAEQDQRAAQLLATKGPSAWPNCA